MQYPITSEEWEEGITLPLLRTGTNGMNLMIVEFLLSERIKLNQQLLAVLPIIFSIEEETGIKTISRTE